MANNNNNNNNNNNRNNNEHVEFSVRAEEDLYLEGSEQTIRRVTASTNYSCLMLKTQRFSSLFRHYAKYHGLRKDELEYYFVNLLENEDTPETVQLQRGDTIMVRKRRQPDYPILHEGNKMEFFKDMKELFLVEDDSLKDVHFQVEHSSSSDSTPPPIIRAHKCVLVARSPFFKALFRTNSFSDTACVHVESIYQPKHVNCVLEFIYTNRVAGLKATGSSKVYSLDDLILLSQLSDQWMIEKLLQLVELNLLHTFINSDTVALLFVHARTKPLKDGCLAYIKKHFKQLANQREFQELMKEHPECCYSVLQTAVDRIPTSYPDKKPRTIDF